MKYTDIEVRKKMALEPIVWEGDPDDDCLAR